MGAFSRKKLPQVGSIPAAPLSHLAEATVDAAAQGTANQRSTVQSLTRRMKRLCDHGRTIPSRTWARATPDMETDWEKNIDSSPTRKELEVLVEEKLSTNQQWMLTAWRANGTLGRVNGGWEGRHRARRGFSPTALPLKPHWEDCIQNSKDVELLEWVHRRTTLILSTKNGEGTKGFQLGAGRQ